MGDYSELKRRAERVIDLEAGDGEAPIGEAWDEFEAVATPSAVLALIAENERLRENPHIRSIRSLRGDCADLMAERDQLSAEVAGLKTGYEAYERVNAELKAEVEGLRKDAELHAQIQRAAGELPIGWEIRVCVEHESGYVELWDQDGCEVDFPNSCESLGLTVSDAIDAAMGQGEQS